MHEKTNRALFTSCSPLRRGEKKKSLFCLKRWKMHSPISCILSASEPPIISFLWGTVDSCDCTPGLQTLCSNIISSHVFSNDPLSAEVQVDMVKARRHLLYKRLSVLFSVISFKLVRPFLLFLSFVRSTWTRCTGTPNSSTSVETTPGLQSTSTSSVSW